MKPLTLFLCRFPLLISHAEPPGRSGGGPAWPRLNVAERPLALAAVTETVLTENPSIKEARAKWEAMKQRVPQARAWDDLKVIATTTLVPFVVFATNSFTDQMLSVAQMIPISGT